MRFLFSILALSASAAFATFQAIDPTSIPLSANSMVGTWILEGRVKAVRFDLRSNGTFQYKGYGSASTGQWRVDGDHVRLVWKQVDSMPVESGKVTGRFPVEDGTLRVGNFQYRKKPKA